MQNSFLSRLQKRGFWAAGCVAMCLSLGGCLDDWMGFPGPGVAYGPDRAPERAELLLSNAAKSLQTQAYNLPQPPVDFAMRLQPRPAHPDRWLSRAALSDALGGETLTQRVLWLTRLRNAEPVPRTGYVLDTQTARLMPWAKSARRTHVLTDPTLALAAVSAGAAQADDLLAPVVWLEPSAADLGRYQAVIDALVDTSSSLLLVNCAGGDQTDMRMRTCIEWLRQSPQVFVLLDTVAGSMASQSALIRLLQQPQFFSQVRYASHWPLPAENTGVRLRPLADAGLIPADAVSPLRELYSVNPLAFDLTLKRLLRLPGTEIGFPDHVFGPLVPVSDGDLGDSGDA